MNNIVEDHTISHFAWITGKCDCCPNTVGITSIHMDDMTIQIFENRRISPAKDSITIYFEEQDCGSIVREVTVPVPPLSP